MSKEFIAVYKCDRCGKQMESQYAILTLKRAGCNLGTEDLVNEDLCVDCYDIMKRAMDKNYVVFHKGFTSYVTTKSNGNVASIPASAITDSSSNRGTYVTWTGNDDGFRHNEVDPLNKHLDVMCV